MTSPRPILEAPLSAENEAATAQLESLARILGEGVPILDGYESKASARLARPPTFFEKQGKKLLELAAQQNAILPSEVFKHINPISTGTAEVIVYPNEDRVYKATKGFNFFGYTLFCNDYRSQSPHLHQIKATPAEYLERLALLNRVFGSDNRFEGVIVGKDREPHMVTSQHYFNSEEVSKIEAEDIFALMAQKGFYRLDRAWHDGYFRPPDGMVVDDTNLGNFKRDEKGKILPIDLLIIQVDPQKLKSPTPFPIPELLPPPLRFQPLIPGLQRLPLARKEAAENGEVRSH